MRKSTLALVCLVGLAMLASCKKDPVVPIIKPLESASVVTPNASIYSGDTVVVGFVVEGEHLSKVEVTISQNDTILASDNVSDLDAELFTYMKEFTLVAEGTVNIRGTVIDAAGQTATTDFNILCNEKPNAKFVGHYEGDALITGSYDIEFNMGTMNPIHEDFEDRPFATLVDIVAGDDMNEVTAVITINEQVNTVKGTVDGNKVVFEAIHDTYNMTYQTFTIPIDMSYSISATLNGNQLELDGDCTGSGEFNMVFVSGTLSLQGTVGGALTKTE